MSITDSSKILLLNGKIVTPKKIFEGSVVISKGKIETIYEKKMTEKKIEEIVKNEEVIETEAFKVIDCEGN